MEDVSQGDFTKDGLCFSKQKQDRECQQPEEAIGMKVHSTSRENKTAGTQEEAIEIKHQPVNW